MPKRCQNAWEAIGLLHEAASWPVKQPNHQLAGSDGKCLAAAMQWHKLLHTSARTSCLPVTVFTNGVA